MLDIIFSLIAGLSKKNKDIWVIGEWNGLGGFDNGFIFHEYLRKYHPEIQSYFLVKEQQLKDRLRDKVDNVISAEDDITESIIKSASVVFYTHNIKADLIRKFVSIDTIRVNLWHGMPIKKIGIDDKLTNSYFRRWLFKSGVYHLLFNEYFNFHLSLGPKSSEILARAKGVNVDKMAEIGFPRFEAIVRNINHLPENEVENNIKVIYMPTFIGAPSSKAEINDYITNIRQVDDFCVQKGVELVINFHPTQKIVDLEIISQLKNVSILDKGFYESINEYDILISDFSSVIFDYYYTGNNIYLYNKDPEGYTQHSREIYIPSDSLSIHTDFINVLATAKEDCKSDVYSVPEFIKEICKVPCQHVCSDLVALVKSKLNKK